MKNHDGGYGGLVEGKIKLLLIRRKAQFIELFSLSWRFYGQGRGCRACPSTRGEKVNPIYLGENRAINGRIDFERDPGLTVTIAHLVPTWVVLRPVQAEM